MLFDENQSAPELAKLAVMPDPNPDPKPPLKAHEFVVGLNPTQPRF